MPLWGWIILLIIAAIIIVPIKIKVMKKLFGNTNQNEEE